MEPALVLSSDSHVFEPPDLWTTRIDAAFRDRAPRMLRIDGADQLVVEADQVLSGIGLISNAGARFDAPETISSLRALRGRAPRRVRPRPAPRGHAARRRGRRGALPVAGPLLLQGRGPRADVGDLPRLQRLARRVLPHRSRAAQGHRDGQRRRRRRRHPRARAHGADGLRGRDDHGVPAGGPPLRPAGVRAVLGGRAGPRHAAEPAHGHAAAGQDPRRGRQDAARREQPRDQGLLPRHVDVRHDLLRRVRAPSAPAARHRRVRAGVGARISCRRWTTRTASGTRRRSTGSRTACGRATSSTGTSA